MKNTGKIFALLAALLLILCQDASALGGKSLDIYRDSCYSVSVERDIVYGKAEGYWASMAEDGQDLLKIFGKGYPRSFKKRELELSLDLYSPEGVSAKRPLIMFIHGGAFYFGIKDDPAYIDFCNYFSSMGYVTASINYRLGFHISKNEIERAGYVALQDAHAALRYLVAHADEYNIDTDRIFVAGSSAGGITALNLAFMKDDDRPESSRGKKAFLSNKADLGEIESSGNEIQADFKISAIASMWGAVSDLEMLENGQTSILTFHGEEDNVVPYADGYPLSMAGEGIAKMLSEEMYGSASIDEKAEELGLRHAFYSFPGEGHALNSTGNQLNENQAIIKRRMNEFFFGEMVPKQARIVSDHYGYYHVVGTGISDVQWEVEGGNIHSMPDNNSISIIWREGEEHAIKATGTYGNEIGWTAILN